MQQAVTKISDVLLAIENCDMDEVVTFSADAVFKNEGDTSIRKYLKKLTIEHVCMRLCWSIAKWMLFMRLRSMWGHVAITRQIFCCDNNPGISSKQHNIPQISLFHQLNPKVVAPDIAS